MKTLHGVFAPVVTTFDAVHGELDVSAFASNVRAHLAAGLHGIVVTGSTGEAALLDGIERNALIDAARDIIPADKWLIAGVGAESTRTCLQFVRDAARRGADAVLVVAPHYYTAAMTEAALLQHYRRIADGSPVPVLLYSIPKYMHFSLSPALVAELARHENVIGIKDSSGNRDLFASYMESQSTSFSVLTGNAPMFHHALSTGATGGILAVALFAAKLSLDIYNDMASGHAPAAESTQARMTPLGARIVGELGVPGVKAAMDRVGLTGGPVRSPLLPLGAGDVSVVEELLQAVELTPA